MGNLSASIGIQNRYPKARQFARSPVLFASIQLGKNIQGFILNASEGGVCVQTAREIVGDEPLDLRFQSVRPGAWVNARGRIVWKNESNTVAGLQFLDADKEIAGEVRNWLNFGESLQELRGDWWPDSQPPSPPEGLASPMIEPTPISLPSRAPAPIEMPAPPSAAATLPDYGSFETDEESAPPESPKLIYAASGPRPNPDSPAPEPAAPVVIGFPSQPQRDQRYTYDYVRPSSVQEEHREKFAIAGIAAAVCVLLLVGWFVFDKGQRAAGSAKATAPAVASEPASAAPSASAPSAVKPLAAPPLSHASAAKPVAPSSSAAASPRVPVPAIVAPPTSGLVLQVGAMSEQANADKLANSLKSAHFAAFVSKRDGDRFYRVLVGPFPAEAPLREAADNLKKSGYDSIEKHAP